MTDKKDLPKYVYELLSASREGIESLTKQLSSMVQYSVIVTNSLFQLVSSSIESEEEAIIVDENFMIPSVGNIEDNLIFQCQFALGHQTTHGIVSKIKSKKKTIGYLILVCNLNDRHIDHIQPIITYATSLYALCFERKLELRNEKLKLKEIFIFDLLYGNMKQTKDIVNYGKLWGWNFAIPHVVIVFSIKDFDFFTRDPEIIRSLHSIIEKTLLFQNILPITLGKEQEVNILFPFYSVTDTSSHQHIMDTVLHIFKKFEGTLLSDRIACGIGKVYEDPTELFRSYQEAKVAYDIGLLLDIPIPFFSELGLERILYKHDLHDLKEFYDHTLRDLQRYDHDNKTNLMDILKVFVTCQFNITRTAQELFIHKNTLRYKVNKIEKILGQKLDDMNTRLNILAAIKIKRLKKI